MTARAGCKAAGVSWREFLAAHRAGLALGALTAAGVGAVAYGFSALGAHPALGLAAGLATIALLGGATLLWTPKILLGETLADILAQARRKALKKLNPAFAP